MGLFKKYKNMDNITNNKNILHIANIKMPMLLLTLAVSLFITSCNNTPLSPGNNKTQITSSDKLENQVQDKQENLTVFKPEKLDNEIVDCMTHVRNSSLSFNNQGNLQVFLTELGVDNNNSKNTSNIEALVTYGAKKRIKYFDYKTDNGEHFYSQDTIKNGNYIYKTKEIFLDDYFIDPGYFKDSPLKYKPACIFQIYKQNGQKVKLSKSKTFNMTKLLKDKNDYFFVNIIGFIGKNKIRAIYNSEQGYGGIAIFNIKTGNIKTELKTDFRIMYIYDNYIYGDNSKYFDDNSATKYYIANRKTGKILHTTENRTINSTKSPNKSFNNGKFFWIENNGNFIVEDIYNNTTKCLGTIKDNEFFTKYMVLNMKAKNENEFYIVYSKDWPITKRNEFDGTQSNLFIVKYTKQS